MPPRIASNRGGRGGGRGPARGRPGRGVGRGGTQVGPSIAGTSFPHVKILAFKYIFFISIRSMSQTMSPLSVSRGMTTGPTEVLFESASTRLKQAYPSRRFITTMVRASIPQLVE